MPKQKKAKPAQLPRPAAPLHKEPPKIPRGLLGVADAVGEGQPDDAHPAWRLSLLDLDHTGSWSWRIGEKDMRKILDFLKEMERKTWKQIKAELAHSKRSSHRKHHAMVTDTLCSEARKRIEALQLEGLDLFRFRLGNMERLWGVIIGGVFYPVWWDPHHEVYPSDPS
jgi:DNA-binding TFAR19-related protein (PDSD5 family)